MGFSGLSIGLSALIAQRRAIEITGHNVANVGTEGYSRQRIDLQAIAGPIVPALHSRYFGAGLGVESGSVLRMRDQFLELRGYQEHAALSHAEEVATAWGRIEGLIAEPSDLALGAQLADFYAGWDDVANRPDDPAARAQLIQRATTLASSFQRLDEDLAAMRDDAEAQLDALVLDVNATAARIAEVNATIQNAVNSGLNASDLMDTRDRLIASLAEKIGVTVRPGEAGTMDVFLGGTALVRGTRAEALGVQVGPAPTGELSVVWRKDGLTADVSGTAAGYIETANVIVPGFRQALRDVADLLRTETNAIHQTGHGIDGPPPSTGLDFFVTGPGTVVEINPVLVADPRAIGAAAAPGTVDGSIAARLAEPGQADRAYQELVVALGVDAQTANRRRDIQSAITQQVDYAREAESGVNLDEEMTNLVAYQHAYEAAARFVAAIDEMLDTLVNLGRR